MNCPGNKFSGNKVSGLCYSNMVIYVFLKHLPLAYYGLAPPADPLGQPSLAIKKNHPSSPSVLFLSLFQDSSFFSVIVFPRSPGGVQPLSQGRPPIRSKSSGWW